MRPEVRVSGGSVHPNPSLVPLRGVNWHVSGLSVEVAVLWRSSSDAGCLEPGFAGSGRAPPADTRREGCLFTNGGRLRFKLFWFHPRFSPNSVPLMRKNSLILHLRSAVKPSAGYWVCRIVFHAESARVGVLSTGLQRVWSQVCRGLLPCARDGLCAFVTSYLGAWIVPAQLKT